MKKLLNIILTVALIMPAAALADDKPFRITLEDQWAESGDGSCYCILNGEKIPTLEDLASRSYKLTQRLHTEEVLTPEELAVWDRYHELEESRRI